MEGKSNHDHAIETQGKYRAYLLGLVFTVLAAAIHTADLLPNSCQMWAEFLAWGLLFTSGVTGIFCAEGLPLVYERKHNVDVLSSKVEAVQSHPNFLGIRPKETDELFTSLFDQDKALRENVLQSDWNYRLHRWLFLLGLLALIVSRVWTQLDTVSPA